MYIQVEECNSSPNTLSKRKADRKGQRENKPHGGHEVCESSSKMRV